MIKLDETETAGINEYLEGTTIEELIARNRVVFHFYVMFNKMQSEQDIEVLDLSQRAYHCLKRNGYSKVGDIVRGFHTKEGESSKKQLQKLRNLGRNTAEEILIKLFLYQFSLLEKKKKKEYVRDVVERNN